MDIDGAQAFVTIIANNGFSRSVPLTLVAHGDIDTRLFTDGTLHFNLIRNTGNVVKIGTLAHARVVTWLLHLVYICRRFLLIAITDGKDNGRNEKTNSAQSEKRHDETLRLGHPAAVAGVCRIIRLLLLFLLLHLIFPIRSKCVGTSPCNDDE